MYRESLNPTKNIGYFIPYLVPLLCHVIILWHVSYYTVIKTRGDVINIMLCIYYYIYYYYITVRYDNALFLFSTLIDFTPKVQGTFIFTMIAPPPERQHWRMLWNESH